MNQRRIEALKNLAERPGTPHEGAVAREKLAREQANLHPQERIIQFERVEEYRACQCGYLYPSTGICERSDEHARIANEIRRRFPRGTRVYYNRWAYVANCPAVVTGAALEWHRIRVKFDHLSTGNGYRSIPIYERGVWFLSTEPLSPDACRVFFEGGSHFSNWTTP